MSCYNSTVPSSPPQNVMVTSVDPASLMVSWQLPSLIHHNGMITGYMINYTRVEISDMMSMNVNSGTTQHMISGLVAYVDYSVTVAASTVNGTGVFDNPTIRLSGQDSGFIYSYDFMNCYLLRSRDIQCYSFLEANKFYITIKYISMYTYSYIYEYYL